MLTCRDVHDLGSDYLDGTLPRRQRLAMRLHLALCRNCRHYLDQLRRTAALVRESLKGTLSPDKEERLLDAVRAASSTRKPPSRDDA